MRFRKTIKKKIKAVSVVILEILEDLADLNNAFLLSAGSTRLFHQKLRENMITKDRASDQLEYLERIGYIERVKEKKSYSVKLTLKGKIKLLENSTERKTDGKWRMISFDIPEELRNNRNRFRSAIKRIGFRQVQQSLWACPFTKADQIEKIINYYEVNDYVAYLIIEKTDIEKYLRKIFKDELQIHKN